MLIVCVPKKMEFYSERCDSHSPLLNEKDCSAFLFQNAKSSMNAILTTWTNYHCWRTNFHPKSTMMRAVGFFQQQHNNEKQ